ncbi:uncharacterized protein LOC131549824 isoform X2 [Onychostoma macrolepis]|uniref:uncharacterized protein LOC131549824 isoform X2 n=1 Tax=Onychostoma macrolepis TaxID=369639 RepID=UPI00272B729D|nr:uncharacterized protein LOC131549824 isoform X2 [Onychostoma macrolepis]
MFYLSHSELFTRSVNIRHLICVYSLKTQPEIRSPHSDTYTIRALPQAKLRASASVILETDTVHLSCEDTEDLKMEMEDFLLNIYVTANFTMFLTGSNVMSTTETTIYSKTAALTVMSTSDTTTYSKTDIQSKTSMTKETMLSTAASNQKAPQMNTVISTEIPVSCRTDAPNVPVTHTEGPPTPQHKGIILRKKRRKRNTRRSIKPDVTSQGIGMSCSGSAETYSLITSVPATSQPISGGLEHPESHQDSTADPTDTHSMITSINPIYQPSDVLVNKQQKGGNPEENEVCVDETKLDIHQEHNTNTFTIVCVFSVFLSFSVRMFIICTPRSLTNQFTRMQEIKSTVWSRCTDESQVCFYYVEPL